MEIIRYQHACLSSSGDIFPDTYRKEAPACWPAILDKETFYRVQKELKKQHPCRRKPESENRYPFLLTGLVRCASCGAHLVGKSAHGNGGKVPYYEHRWATCRETVTLKKGCDLKPFRLQAKKLEPLAWAEIERIMKSPQLDEKLVSGLLMIHAKKTKSSGVKKLTEKVR